MRVAIVHDWLTGMRGGEKVLEVFCELYPQADIFTLLHVPGSVSQTIESHKIFTSFVQRLPFARKHYRSFLPLFPVAIEKFDLNAYELVLSISHCVAKGVITPPETCHISCVLSPMRYVWDLYHDYFGKDRAGVLSRKITPFFATYLRAWDVTSSARVDQFVAISSYVAKRIRKYYRRDAAVIHPPVETDRFRIAGKPRGNFHLVVSALVPYKRIDLAVKAANRLGFRLLVIGKGPQEKYLRKMAGRNVEFLGYQPDEVVARCYSDCKALIFPGKEDFGIVSLEAMASGRPVIAYGRGGALDTVVPLNAHSSAGSSPAPTGIMFYEQTVDALCEALKTFEENSDRFDPAAMRRHALKFDRSVFKKKIDRYLKKVLSAWR